VVEERTMNLRGVAAIAALATGPFTALGEAAAEPVDLYFDQTPPGETPEVFAPGIISLADRFEQFLLYSPDGQQLLYSVTNADWSSFTIEALRLEDGKWSQPETASFLGAPPDALVACFSYDMQRVFFTSSRPAYPPANIWMALRHGTGWSEPKRMGPPISSDGDEFEVAIAENGTLYFSSSREGGFGDLDVYRAPLVDGDYPAVENLGPAINTAAGDDLPYIAPDESYLLFASNREGTLGERDLYISFHLNGVWTLPLNLGPSINSEGFDIYPFVSADGKYLFFTRRKEWETSEDSDIYWVSAGVIDRLRAVVLREQAGAKD
jgi:hypothetical protein